MKIYYYKKKKPTPLLKQLELLLKAKQKILKRENNLWQYSQQ